MSAKTNERRLKITVGKKPAKAGPENGVGIGPVVSMDGRILCHTVIWPGYDESEANAALYADAHNTANEVDLLPSELLAKLREAEKTIADLEATCHQMAHTITTFDNPDPA